MGDIIRKLCGADFDEKWRAQSEKAVITPEPRELAACGFPKSQRLRVSEGPPWAPSFCALLSGAPSCSLTPRAWQAPAPGERGAGRVGAAFGRPSKYSPKGTFLISLFSTGPDKNTFPLKKIWICTKSETLGEMAQVEPSPVTLLFCLLLLLPPRCSVLDLPECLFRVLNCLLPGSYPA